MAIKTVMVKVLMGLMVCSSATLALAQDERSKKPFKPDPARGHVAATKLCATCHIIDKRQAGPAQPGVPSFHYMANKPGQSSEKLGNVMIHPFPPMIDAHLTIHEIKDISAYILSLKTGNNLNE